MASQNSLHNWLSDGDEESGLQRSLVKSILQAFENRRPGLSNETIAGGEEAVHQYFTELLEKEIPRLSKKVKVQQSHLSEEVRSRFLDEVLELVRSVVIPAYVRSAMHFTPRERNDFYLLPQPFHGVERVGWGICGIVLGAFVVWAPFIPIWSKEFILLFMIAGLFFPNLRQLYSTLQYESDLKKIVSKADQEISRIELAYFATEAEAGLGSLELDSAKDDGSRIQSSDNDSDLLKE